MTSPVQAEKVWFGGALCDLVEHRVPENTFHVIGTGLKEGAAIRLMYAYKRAGVIWNGFVSPEVPSEASA